MADFRSEKDGTLDLPLGWTMTPPNHFIYEGTGKPAWMLNDLRRLPSRRAGDGRRRRVVLDADGHRLGRRPRRVGPRDVEAGLDPLGLLASGPVPGVVSVESANELAIHGGLADSDTRRGINADLEPAAVEARNAIAEINRRQSREIEGRIPRLPCRIACPRCGATNLVTEPPTPI